jgi:hypothetical protein
MNKSMSNDEYTALIRATRDDTRAGCVAALRKLGITSEAATLLANVSGLHRHERRVLRVLDLAADLDGGETELFWLCLFEGGGSGGRAGLGGPLGRSTTRLAIFGSLGTGRQHASDGGAWDAAIRDAARELMPRVLGDGRCGGQLIPTHAEGAPDDGVVDSVVTDPYDGSRRRTGSYGVDALVRWGGRAAVAWCGRVLCRAAGTAGAPAPHNQWFGDWTTEMCDLDVHGWTRVYETAVAVLGECDLT